jgi:hypothetical protein
MALTTRVTKTVFDMPIRNDFDAFPVGTVIRIKRTNEFAIIRQQNFLKDRKGFLHYLVEIEDKQGLYCALHDDIDLEHLPLTK